MKNEEPCPCKSGKTFGECCGPIISGARQAETAEALMRARYSCYVSGDVEFLRTSATKAVQTDFDEESSRAWSKAAKWHGLEIIATEKKGFLFRRVYYEVKMEVKDGSWEQYFHEELMPKVEEGFKCNGKRAIAGLSMGGYGTLYHALKYPRKFTYAYAMSPATAVTFTAFIDAQADKKVFPPFTIEVGTEDGTVNNADSETLATYMKDQGMTCEWISRPGTHDWKFWQECLPKTLKRVGESFK